MADNKRWYSDTGSHGDVVLATRVRLSRNLDGVPFPSRLSRDALARIAVTVCAVAEKFKDFDLRPIAMESLHPYEAVALAERHLISADFAAARENRVLLLSEDESIAVMVNERDHLRMQTMYGGLCTEKAYGVADRLDNAFDEVLTYAFDDRLGYLTQNPADLGTAMRASVILHLPVLSAQGVMLRFAATAPKLGLSVRSLFGEGASAKGDLYVLTNRVTMGLSEQAALQNLEAFTLQLATRERAAAETYVSQIAVQDRIRRAHGMLTNAMLLSADEMSEALSLVRLGSVYGILDVPAETVNELFVAMQPANLNCLAGAALDASDRDVLRARFVRSKLSE
ncbi:MAG: ATP--guanido phosphotransferase [Clostridia bacterium]|nr:ATP--guanido phosphotransferase [Clostridia bacterium]